MVTVDIVIEINLMDYPAFATLAKELGYPIVDILQIKNVKAEPRTAPILPKSNATVTELLKGDWQPDVEKVSPEAFVPMTVSEVPLKTEETSGKGRGSRVHHSIGKKRFRVTGEVVTKVKDFREFYPQIKMKFFHEKVVKNLQYNIGLSTVGHILKGNYDHKLENK